MTDRERDHVDTRDRTVGVRARSSLNRLHVDVEILEDANAFR
jgi:hypothetical protein